MNLEQLRGFATIAQTGHFTRAADALRIAQPTLSKQIATLERELGSELFHRARGNIALTAAGEALLPRARRMLADEEAIRVEMAELAGLQRGRVRLGATPTLCVSIVAEAMAVYARAHPGVDLHLAEAGSRVLIEQLAGGSLDLALVTTTATGPGLASALTSSPLLVEELVVATSAAVPVVAESSIDLATLAGLPLIFFDESYDLRAATDTAFREAGLAPSPVVEGAEMDAVLRFVERGLGVALVPATVLVERPALRGVRVATPTRVRGERGAAGRGDPLTRTISIAHRADVKATRAAAAMREVVLRATEELAAASPETLRVVAPVGSDGLGA